MKVVFQTNKTLPPCVVKFTGRVRLHVEAIAWCSNATDASELGVITQVPDHVKCCAACEDAIKRAFPAP